MTRGIVIALLIAGSAFAVEPALTIPDAVRIERNGDGSQTAILRDGTKAWITPTRDGYAILFSDGRQGERWTKTSSGFLVTKTGAGPARGPHRVDKTTTRTTRTSDGVIVHDASGTKRWTTTRDGYAVLDR